MSSILSGSSSESQPHAILIPYPLQGHINPCLQLAKILHTRGFHITFVNTEYNHNRLLRSQGADTLADRPSFRFRTIPDGLPPSDVADSSQHVPSLCSTTETNCLGPFKELIACLNDEAGDDVPPVSCIVSDGAMFFTVDAAEELGIPIALFWTASACGLLGYDQYQKLIDLELFPFKDANFATNGDINTILDWVPAMEGIQMKDMPSFIRTTDRNDFMVNYLPRLIHKLKKASAVIFNSFDALEHEVLEALTAAEFPPLYCLGPLELLLDSVQSNTDSIETEVVNINTSLWKEDTRCIEWLDESNHEPNSVVYVNFGSVTVMTNDELVEFAWGLANSNLPFLWITRPDLVTGESAVLPPEFLEGTKDRGLITSWCDQRRVMAHPAIGGFLTHSGWNSTVESLTNGLPMICWPFFAEQQTNSWFSCNKWGVGMEIDMNNVNRSEIERQVRELMEGEEGKVMKSKAMEWKRLAYEVTTSPNGSSYNNLDKVIKLLMS